MVAIIDYDAGNIKSVEKAVQALGVATVVTRDETEILNADHVILPGVGAFEDAMKKLRTYQLDKVIVRVIENGTPFLGICLGLQVLFESSEEGNGVSGLGILKGKICKIPDDKGVKVPHIGWNSLECKKESRLLKNLPSNPFVYFVHSYFLQATDSNIVSSTTEYATHIHASIEMDNVYACQFHPEKSSTVGLQILDNFLASKKEDV